MTCTICNQPAISMIKVDLDLPGIGMCKAHESDVQAVYHVMLIEGYDKAMKLLDSFQKKKKKSPAKR